MARYASACLSCRTNKRKCRVQVDSVDGSCSNCLHSGIECSLMTNCGKVSNESGSNSLSSPYPVPKSAVRAELAPRSGPAIHSSSLPSHEICRGLVNVYFELLDNSLGSLFHRSSFIKEFEEHHVPPIILLCICSLTARFSEHSYFHGIDRWERGTQWGQEARQLFNIHLMDVSIRTLQVCHLLASLASAEGDMKTNALCSAIGNKIVELLGLPNRLSDNALEREIEIRVWSTFYMHDVWSSAGRQSHPAIRLEPGFPWPVEELVFHRFTENTVLLAGESLTQENPTRLNGMWAQMIPLTYISDKIHHLNHLIISQSPISQEQYLTSTSELKDELDHWVQNLPSRLQYSTPNLAFFAEHGQGHVFIALHVGYNYHSILLFFRFLQRVEDPLIQKVYDTYSHECKRHATAISEQLWNSQEHYNVKCVWLMVGHMLVISSSVHLHTLLLDNDQDAVNKARSLLNQNFQILMNLRAFWPWLDQSMVRLRAFHEACFKAQMALDAFKMNTWLLQFLQEHAVVINAEETNACSPGSDIFKFGSWDDATIF